MTIASEGATAEVVVLDDVERVFAVVTAADPPSFYPKHGPLPAVTGVTEQSGEFAAVGDHRRLQLSDGGSVVETVRVVDTPRFFAYELSRFEKLFGHLVSGARAEWTFTPLGSGTRVHWSYEFFPRPGTRLLVRAIVVLFWRPYMRRVLPPIGRAAGPLR